jgi:hypothetical protein
VDSTVLTSTNVAESEALWLVGTTYGAAAVVYYPVDGIHTRFISSERQHRQRAPRQPDDWTDDGPTNRYAMFDETVSTLTTNANTIAVELTLPATSGSTALYLAGLDALSVRDRRSRTPSRARSTTRPSAWPTSAASYDWYAWYFYDPVATSPSCWSSTCRTARAR